MAQAPIKLIATDLLFQEKTEALEDIFLFKSDSLGGRLLAKIIIKIFVLGWLLESRAPPPSYPPPSSSTLSWSPSLSPAHWAPWWGGLDSWDNNLKNNLNNTTISKTISTTHQSQRQSQQKYWLLSLSPARWAPRWGGSGSCSQLSRHENSRRRCRL